MILNVAITIWYQGIYWKQLEPIIAILTMKSNMACEEELELQALYSGNTD